VFSYNVANGPASKLAYVSSSLPGGRTSRVSDNVVWSSSPSGGTGHDVSCCIRLHIVCVEFTFWLVLANLST